MLRPVPGFLARQRKRSLLIGLAALFLFVGGACRFITNRGVPELPVIYAHALSVIFTPEVQRWTPLIQAWALAYDVDPNLIATVIQIESCGDPDAVSSSGAQGLFQVMPNHFKSDEDSLDVLTNGQRGMEYLASGLNIADGDAGLALAGYNGGHGVIHRDQGDWPAETRRYFYWGTGIYQDAVAGNTSSATMQQWLKAGGVNMCRRASNRDILVASK